MKLEGFGIFVNSMPEMIKFYRDVLGFEIKEEADSANNVYLVKDGTLFLLYDRNDFKTMTGKKFNFAPDINGHYEIAMSVENYATVDTTFAKVVANGAIPVMEPTTEPWGQRTSYIADPEGNLIEIGSFTKE